MPSTPIKSCNKYILSYKDSSNKTHEVGFYARDAYDCLMLAREFNSYVHDNPGSVIRIQQKFWGELIMNLKRSPFAIQDKNARDLDNAKDYPTIADLMREQKVPHDYGNTVHHRRDLDSLG